MSVSGLDPDRAWSGDPISRHQQPTSHGGVVARSRKARVVIAKPGLDGHDRGAKVVARALRDAGIEVIYTGLHQSPEQIVAAALQENADAVGLSVLSGAHMTLFPRVLELLQESDASDVILFGGGIIPDDDVKTLEAMGVARIFGPGSSTVDIVTWLQAQVADGNPSGAVAIEGNSNE